jgi:hypothetical protein
MLVKSSIDSSYNNNLFPNQNYMEQLHDRNIYLLGNCHSLEDHNMFYYLLAKHVRALHRDYNLLSDYMDDLRFEDLCNGRVICFNTSWNQISYHLDMNCGNSYTNLV